MQSYQQYATSSSEPVTGPVPEPPPPAFKRSKGVKSESELSLKGPLDIHGSVKSGGSIDFDGDFFIRDKIDAYGAITINGNVSAE